MWKLLLYSYAYPCYGGASTSVGWGCKMWNLQTELVCAAYVKLGGVYF